jgi:U3 small nucleolar ribonucleoprotein protein IMP4
MNRRKKREYLLRKEDEEKNIEIEGKKEILKEHISSNKRLPHDLRKEAPEILEHILYSTKEENSLPLLYPLITTSRDPSGKLTEFVKKLKLILNGEVVKRGNMKIEDISRYMACSNHNLLILVNEYKGTPSSIIYSLYPYGPTYYFSIHNFKGERKGKPHSSKVDFMWNGPEGSVHERVKRDFSRMFPVNSHAGQRIVAMCSKNDMIYFRHYFLGDDGIDKDTFSFDLKLYEIVSGWFETGGEKEWVYKPYMNTSKKVGLT